MDTRRQLAGLLVLALLGACSVRRIAVGGLAGVLARSSEVYAAEDDPELVRASLPFALTAIQTALLEDPERESLILGASSGFTLYAHAFLEPDAERLEETDRPASEALRERALRLYLRGRDYALAELERRHPGLGERLRRDPETGAAEIEAPDVDLAYWTASAWGLAIALGKDRAELIADLEAVRALLARLLELDETYARGGLHEALIAIEALPATMGGSPERARAHFRRALELGGERPGPYVSLAAGVCVSAQAREEFVALLRHALAIDLDAASGSRLANRLARQRAERLLAETENLFL